MANDRADLIEKISELEHELAVKEAELHRYRLELGKVNKALEAMIGQMSQELKLAQAMQKIITPVELPNIQGFEFSTKFNPGTRSGGDYFDVFEHEDKLKFGILISSASGYSLSSILLSIIIKISSQIEARRGLGAAEVVTSLLSEVVPLITTEDTASIFYGIVDRRNFELQYCSVGNISGFIQLYGQEELLKLDSHASAASRNSQGISLQGTTVSLNPRDRLILGTEGFVNAENSKAVRWGEQGLRKAIMKAPKLGVHDLRNEIIYSVEQYSQKIDPVRDQTLIIAEVKDRVIKLASR